MTLLPQEYLRWETAPLLPSAGRMLGNGTGFLCWGLAGQRIGRARGDSPHQTGQGVMLWGALGSLGTARGVIFQWLSPSRLWQIFCHFPLGLKPWTHEEFSPVGSAKSRNPLPHPAGWISLAAQAGFYPGETPARKVILNLLAICRANGEALSCVILKLLQPIKQTKALVEWEMEMANVARLILDVQFH